MSKVSMFLIGYTLVSILAALFIGRMFKLNREAQPEPEFPLQRMREHLGHEYRSPQNWSEARIDGQPEPDIREFARQLQERLDRQYGRPGEIEEGRR
jgi:hypothetical protein